MLCKENGASVCAEGKNSAPASTEGKKIFQIIPAGCLQKGRFLAIIPYVSPAGKYPGPGTKIILCGYGGIGRRTRFRFWRSNPYRFKSCYPYHRKGRRLLSAVFRFACIYAGSREASPIRTLESKIE